MDYHEKLSRILRTDKNNLIEIEKILGKKTGKKDIIFSIGEENDLEIEKCLKTLGLSRTSSAKSVFDALINKISHDDKMISDLLGNPRCDKKEGCDIIVDSLKEFSSKKGFFVKKEKFSEFLYESPPQNVIDSLGYSDVKGLLENEDIFEIAAALRFIEGGEWMNKNFLPKYSTLSADDFETREIKMITVSEKWKNAAETFIKKKYHNISHLKELGLIFIIPTSLDTKGEVIRTISLLLHYLHEIEFYSNLFERISKKHEKDFAESIIKLLRGDIIEDEKSVDSGDWLIVQRYLAKIDEFDWRLSHPHVNPEAIHWEKAECDIAKLGVGYGVQDLSFWNGLNWVGDYFGTDLGVDVLVSFNIVDNAMSLVKEKEMIKYLYHHQEALWNKIFSSCFGEEEMEEMVKENILNGIIKF